MNIFDIVFPSELGTASPIRALFGEPRNITIIRLDLFIELVLA